MSRVAWSVRYEKDIVCPLLPFDITDQMQHRLSQLLQLVLLMFALLFHFLSMLLPSKLLALPKVSEKMEININSPKTIERESNNGESSMPTPIGQGVDGFVADQATLSSTTSSSSQTLDTAQVKSKRPRSLTPESRIENDGSPGLVKFQGLSALWTEESEKVSQRTRASASHHSDLKHRLSPGHLTT